MRPAVCVLLLTALVATCRAEEAKWKDLIGDGTKHADVFRTKPGAWTDAGDAALDAKNPKLLVGKDGKGVRVNGPKGREPDLVTKETFGDVEIEFDFMMGKGSNSGVKFHALYEIQLLDSFGKKGELTGNDCGGVYPRAEMKPKYHHIDKGTPPKSNACKAPGEWQTLNAIFVAPRFDADGKKTADARLVKVTLNGVVIHENVDLKTPTGHNHTRKESAKGPLMLQGDHGPVAFRKVRVREYAGK